MELKLNQCQQCGACCASFRVSFPADELDDAAGTVPSVLTEPLGTGLACMLGTAAAPFRCRALSGQIGVAAGCKIYELRPQVCRDFAPMAQLGISDASCDAARRRHGLPPLCLANET